MRANATTGNRAKNATLRILRHLVFHNCGTCSRSTRPVTWTALVFQFRLHRVNSVVALTGIAGHGMQDDLFKLGADFPIEFSRRDRIAGNPHLHDHKWIGPLERRAAGCHLIQDGAQAINVGPLIAPPAPFTCSGAM